MKSIITLAIAFIFSVGTLTAKDRVSPHTTVKGDHMSITYGQPSKKGREIFGALVPYGQVWRTGADEATEITFDKDGSFAGKMVKAGTYTLFTIPGKSNWTVILNSKTGQWGSFGYENVKENDVLKAEVPSTVSNGDATEQFTITINDHVVKLMWDKTTVSIPAKF